MFCFCFWCGIKNLARSHPTMQIFNYSFPISNLTFSFLSIMSTCIHPEGMLWSPAGGLAVIGFRTLRTLSRQTLPQLCSINSFYGTQKEERLLYMFSVSLNWKPLFLQCTLNCDIRCHFYFFLLFKFTFKKIKFYEV